MKRWPYKIKGTPRLPRLEPVVVVDDGRSDKAPQWKQEILEKPSVSVRKGIAWGKAAPLEDTDTLVLTAGLGAFVDIRLPKKAKSAEEAKSHPSFWAFTGRVDTYFHDDLDPEFGVEMPCAAHCKFIHDIDSRGQTSKDAGDEGDMFDLKNGDCIEVGTMLNPATNQVDSYKEYWAGVDPPKDSQGRDDSNVCLMARVTEPEDIQGLMIRIGGYVQGMIAKKGQDENQTVDFERWVRHPFEHGKPEEIDDNSSKSASMWHRDERSSCSLPASWLCEHDPFDSKESRVKETTVHEGLTWMITYQDDP